ncbi:MAG: hypothetical protein HY698_14490 [Deltaproteobacteria bacterium]|nr:hypothetical protein [Deltaproteobacteria bacterium]
MRLLLVLERRDVLRLTASIAFYEPLSNGMWATTAVWGRNDETGEDASNGFLVESVLDVRNNLVFGRVEAVQKSTHDLALEERGDDDFLVGKLAVGYTRQVRPFWGMVPGIGAELLVSAVPRKLEDVYGRRFPFGFSVFARIYPRSTKHEQPEHAGARH